MKPILDARLYESLHGGEIKFHLVTIFCYLYCVEKFIIENLLLHMNLTLVSNAR